MPEGRSPAAGERAAMSGFRPQYKVAAHLTLEHLREIVWIAVADPAAGSVDDFSFATSHEVHGLQVKWSLHPAPRTLRSMTSGVDSLIAQLADGWRRLQDRESDKTALVHLITNDIPSTADRLRESPAPRHTAAFLAESVQPTQRSLRGGAAPADTDALRRPWQAAWKLIHEASGLDDADFWDFIAALHLDMNASLERPLASASPPSGVHQDDVKRLAGYFEDLVSEREQRIRVHVRTVIEELGWTRRVQYRNRHMFPVPSDYVENESARDRLNHALTDTSGGYITLLGSPGSGKSTLLAAADFGDARVVHYFAYVPDMPVDPDRGESESFLHDLTEQLHRAGLLAAPPARFELAALRRRLRSQLDRASDDWRQTGRETILVIDGLDHVPRGRPLVRSMLHDLPMPDAIPDGVKVILGTQTTDVLPRPFRQQLSQHGRRIELEPLGDETVLGIAEKAGVLQLVPRPLQSDLVRGAEGHPLALRYLLDELRSAYVPDVERAEGDASPPPTWSSHRRMSEILEDASSYGSDIEARYMRYWNDAADDEDLRQLLASTSRLRGPLHLTWLREWNDVSSVEKLTTTARHFFHRDGDTWFFFHASFRQFLQARTAEVDGDFDQDLDARHHLVLANALASTADEWPLLAAEEIAHRFLGGDFEGALSAASPARLRARIGDLDPLDAVADDVSHALRSAGRLADPVLIARYALLQTELSFRSMALRSEDLATTLAEVGAADIAIRHLRAGRTLRVEPEVALAAVPHLVMAGRRDEAERIAQLAGRLGLIALSKSDGLTRGDVDRVRAWVQAHFSLSEPTHVEAEIDSTLSRDSTEEIDEDERANSDGPQQVLRLHALDELCECLFADDDLPDERLLEKIRNLNEAWSLQVMVKAAHAAIDQGEREAARALTQEISAAPKSQEEILSLYLAELLTRLAGQVDDSIRELVPPAASITLPKLADLRTDDAMESVWPVYVRHRLQHLIGGALATERAITAPKDERQRGAFRFLRSVLEMAELDATRLRHLWCGEPVDPPSPARIRQILSTFDVDHRDSRDWSGWYLASAAAPTLLRRLVTVVATLPRGLDLLIQELERLWDASGRRGWTPERRRAVLVALGAAGADRDWIERRLAANDEPSDFATPHENVEDSLGQARAWYRLGDQQRALDLLRSAVDRSFGPGMHDEDDQLVHWVNWMFDAINQAEPHDPLARVGKMSQRLRGVSPAAEREAARAMQGLIRRTWDLSAPHAAALTRWADRHHLVQAPDLIGALVDGSARNGQVPPVLVGHVIAELYLPLQDQVPDQIRDLLGRAADNSPSKAAEVARVIAGGVARWALPTSRRAWIVAVTEGLETCGAASHDGVPSPEAFGKVAQSSADRRETSSNTSSFGDHPLVLDDGTELSTEEVQSRIAGIESLLALLRNVPRRTDSDDDVPSWRAFAWSPVLDGVLDDLNAHDAIRVLDPLTDLAVDSDAIHLLMRRFQELGSRTGVIRSARLMLARTSLRSWARWYDGGRRATAWKALIAEGVPDARQEAIADLADAFATSSINSNMLPSQLRQLLAVVCDPVPLAELWTEIDSYLDELAPAEPSDQPWSEADHPETTSHPSSELLGLITDYLGHPLRVLDTAARRILRSALEDEKTKGQAAQALLPCLSDATWEAEAGLSVLLGVSEGQLPSRSNPATALKGAVHEACVMRDQIIRDQARGCMSQHAWGDAPPNVQRDLNPRLSLELPPLGPRQPPTIDSTGKPLLNPADVRQRVAPYDVAIEAMAEASGLDSSAAVHYCAEEATRSLTGTSRWLLPDAGALQDELSASGLKHTYRPLALLLGRRAASRLLADLVDSGRLQEADRNWSSVYQLTDQHLALAWPEPRPSSVPDIYRDREESLRGVGDWMADLDEAADRYTDAMAAAPDRVLAEETEFVWLQWETPHERRRLEVVQDRRVRARILNHEGSTEVPGSSLPNALADLEAVHTSSHYTQLAGKPLPDEHHLVVRGTPWTADHLAGQWLAVDPRVAIHLGWQPAADGLFRWLSSEGDFRAESIWWVQGLTSHQPPNFDAEVAEGWRVVISGVGFEELERTFGPLTVSIELERSLGRDTFDPDDVAIAKRESLPRRIDSA